LKKIAKENFFGKNSRKKIFEKKIKVFCDSFSEVKKKSEISKKKKIWYCPSLKDFSDQRN